MNREECENQILEKLKEIKAIAKEYDKSNNTHLSICIMDDYMFINNEYWETATPINIAEYKNGGILRL